MTAVSRTSAGIGSVLALAMSFPAAAQDREFGGEIELVDPNVLRVCADPNNMPFSNQAEQGMEQAIAELLADKLDREDVSYSYFPQATGFVRMTLGSNLCDVIISYPQGDELVQNTNAYYRTSYALVYPKDGDLAGVTTIADPKLKDSERLTAAYFAESNGETACRRLLLSAAVKARAEARGRVHVCAAMRVWTLGHRPVTPSHHTHYVGHVRNTNLLPIESYLLKSLDVVIEDDFSIETLVGEHAIGVRQWIYDDEPTLCTVCCVSLSLWG